MAPRSKARALAIDGRTPSPESVRDTASQKADIYYFQSPKNHRRFVFCDQLVFFLAVLLEADLKVISYSPIEPDATAQGSQPCLTAALFSGDKVSFIACYDAGGRKAANVNSLSDLGTPQDGGQPKIVTAQFIRDHYIQIENWLVMCAIMNRAKNLSCIDESEEVYKDLRRFGTVSLEKLLRGESIDEARMLAAVARGLQAGTLLCDTATEPFTYSSALTLRRGV
jgi:hypothetical protein